MLVNRRPSGITISRDGREGVGCAVVHSKVCRVVTFVVDPVVKCFLLGVEGLAPSTRGERDLLARRMMPLVARVDDVPGEVGEVVVQPGLRPWAPVGDEDQVELVSANWRPGTGEEQHREDSL